ncbi:amidohydrolase family protein [Pseudomonas sp. TH06]|uniref:amidohydrolase n=2 Tax=unclassified Pseudomonas TaxID=196821 RepID=UPI0019148C56|nr:amidohydrolase family protein [Pseudomonas sp. TH06]MBK5528473.1 amidohydrolase family protein [Pseudomonas sp. TH06]
MGSNGNGHNCTHCGCENPVWNALKHKLDLTTLTGKANTLTEPDGESLIFTDGRIYPLKNGNMHEQVEALGIHRGDVIASGTLADVQACMDTQGIQYKTRSLAGKTLLPGLIEPHIHIVQSCLMDSWLDLGPIDKETQRLRQSYDWAYLQRIIGDCKHTDPESWVLGHMVDPALMPFTLSAEGKNHLTTFRCAGDSSEIGNLDSLVKDRPLLMMSASMHTAYLNTAACTIVYRNESAANPEFLTKYPTFQVFMDKTQGVLQEEKGIVPAILSIRIKQILHSLNLFGPMQNYFHQASKRGVTLLYDAMVDPISKLVLEAYGLTHPRNVRIGYAATYKKGMPSYTAVTKEAARYFYQGGVKLISDGSNQGLTGYQNKPYCCETTPELGNFNVCDKDVPQPETMPDAYKELLVDAMATGWPLMIHANGDRAIDFTLEAYKNALDNRSGLEKRHRIEHCSLLTEETVKRLQHLGISPSFLIGHVGYWGYVFDKAIFEDKASDMLDLCKLALDYRLRISLHSDCTVTPLGPLRSMEQAVTRKMEGIRDTLGNFIDDPRQQPVLNEGQCLTRQEALKAITYDAAWQCHADGFTGSLQDGNFADFVILAQDPLDETFPATGIRGIEVCETWKGGYKVYSSTEG